MENAKQRIEEINKELDRLIDFRGCIKDKSKVDYLKSLFAEKELISKQTAYMLS